MSAWLISGFALAYLPTLIQRRFLLGITIPLGILAIYGLNNLIKQASIRMPNILKREGLVYFSYILFASISCIYLSLGLGLHMQTRPADKFYPADIENALIWLDKNATSNDFVLADVKTSQLVAQRTKLKTYVGHEMETLFFNKKKSVMRAYYQGLAPQDWLEQTSVQWVIYGPFEKDISNSFEADAELEIAYKNDTVTIYAVNH